MAFLAALPYEGARRRAAATPVGSSHMFNNNHG
jgi:hypothetical protein